MNGGVSSTPRPRHTAFTMFALTRTTLHGSEMAPVPLYFQPLEPAGEPRLLHPTLGSEYASVIALPVSKIESVAPSTVGWFVMSGRSNAPRAMNLAMTP